MKGGTRAISPQMSDFFLISESIQNKNLSPVASPVAFLTRKDTLPNHQFIVC